MKTITVFKGDGIGPEITDAVLEILKAAKAPLDYEIFRVGEAEYEENGALIPEKAFASFERNKILLKSPITTPVGKGFRSLNVTLREKYDLYANIRPAKSNAAVVTPFKDVDIVTFRENTEDLYVGVEEQIDAGTVRRHENHYPQGQHPDYRRCLCVCQSPGKEESHLRPQGEYFKEIRRLVFKRL